MPSGSATGTNVRPVNGRWECFIPGARRAFFGLDWRETVFQGVSGDLEMPRNRSGVTAVACRCTPLHKRPIDHGVQLKGQFVWVNPTSPADPGHPAPRLRISARLCGCEMHPRHSTTTTATCDVDDLQGVQSNAPKRGTATELWFFGGATGETTSVASPRNSV